MYGCTHTPETKAQMSDAKTGAKHPMYGKSWELSPVSIPVNVYSLDDTLINTFSSQVAAANWLNVYEGTVRNYIKSGKVFRKQYLIVRSDPP